LNLGRLEFLIGLLSRPLFEFAKYVDYVNIIDDEGDLVIIFGRFEKNPDQLASKCVKALQERTGGRLYTDESGRTILTIIVREKRG